MISPGVHNIRRVNDLLTNLEELGYLPYFQIKRKKFQLKQNPYILDKIFKQANRLSFQGGLK